jgi:hypothetical protein
MSSRQYGSNTMKCRQHKRAMVQRHYMWVLLTGSKSCSRVIEDEQAVEDEGPDEKRGTLGTYRTQFASIASHRTETKLTSDSDLACFSQIDFCRASLSSHTRKFGTGVGSARLQKKWRAIPFRKNMIKTLTSSSRKDNSRMSRIRLHSV